MILSAASWMRRATVTLTVSGNNIPRLQDNALDRLQAVITNNDNNVWEGILSPCFVDAKTRKGIFFFVFFSKQRLSELLLQKPV